MGLFDGMRNLASGALGNAIGNVTEGIDLGALGNLGNLGEQLPAVIGEHFNAEQLGEIAQVAGDHLNADQVGDLAALAEENISADQIGNVAGMIQEQGQNLDLGAIAERVGLPTDVIGQISGLLGR